MIVRIERPWVRYAQKDWTDHEKQFDWRCENASDAIESGSADPEQLHCELSSFISGFDPAERKMAEVEKTRSNPHAPPLKLLSYCPHAPPLGFLNRGLDVG
jgi:hypothetical protein